MAPAQTRDSHLSTHFPNIYRVPTGYQAQSGTLLPGWGPRHILEGAAVRAAVLTRASNGMSCPKGPRLLSHFPSLTILNAFQYFTTFSDENLTSADVHPIWQYFSVDSLTSISTCFLKSLISFSLYLGWHVSPYWQKNSFSFCVQR